MTQNPKRKETLTEGNLYYLKDTEKSCIEHFKEALKGRSGLVLAKKRIGNFPYLPYENVDYLLATLHDKLHKHHHQVVYLQGIETLITLNTLPQVQSFLKSFKHLLQETKSTGLLAINTHHPSERSLLNH